MIRVLSAIVVPPHLSVSGGARAGEQLSLALAPYCDVTIANMMEEPHEKQLQERIGPGRVRVHCTLPAPFRLQQVPNRVKSLFYRSDIPALVQTKAFDIVHIHNPIPALEMSRIANACRTSNVPYVISTHGFNEVSRGEEIYGFDWLKRIVWRRFVRSPVAQATRGADAIFMLSPADEPAVREMGYSGIDLPIVSNGIHAPALHNRELDAEVCRKFGISPAREPGQITCNVPSKPHTQQGARYPVQSLCLIEATISSDRRR